MTGTDSKTPIIFFFQVVISFGENPTVPDEEKAQSDFPDYLPEEDPVETSKTVNCFYFLNFLEKSVGCLVQGVWIMSRNHESED